jgi:hypothetical protein
MGCPLCNGLIKVELKCLNCNGLMEDAGSLEDYYGPYSPYEEISTELAHSHEESCVHLMACPVCGWDKRVEIKKVPLPGE